MEQITTDLSIHQSLALILEATKVAEARHLEATKVAEARHLEITFQHQQVVARLDRIEKHVIVIRDKVLSQFEGITEATKTEIESLAVTALEQKEEIIEEAKVWDRSNPDYKTKSFKAKRQEQRQLVMSEVINGYNEPVDGGSFYISNSGREVPERGYLTSCGMWVSSVISQLFEQNFQSRYSPRLKPLIECLVGFWVLERVENGRLY